MNRERDLLARAGLVIAQHRWSHPHDPVLRKLSHQINAYFEEPEVNLEALSDEDVFVYLESTRFDSFFGQAFLDGVRYAEKHHGVGGKG
jgi:hypothetical protein